jgi:tetratricopeptide (TPR) repeat protein
MSNIYKSIFFELLAILFLLCRRDFNGVIIFFIFHSIASFIISTVLVRLISNKYNKNHLLNIYFITVLNTLSVLVGYVASFYICIILTRKQKSNINYKIETLNIYDMISFPEIRRQLGEGVINTLAENKISKDTKLKILDLFSMENNNIAIKIFKFFVADNDTEIRMYSFQSLNRLKNDINKKINMAMNELDKATTNYKKAECYKKLAFYYSYMFKMELSENELRDFFIDKTLYYIKLFKEIMSDGEIIFLEGEIYFIRKEFDTALELLNRSLKFGINTYMVYPVIAEIYFEKKEYQKIRETLNSDFSLKLNFSLYPIVNIWEGIK